MMIKMLVCDFDGTLDGGPSDGVDRFSDYITDQTDLQFVIATGRTLPSIKIGLTTNNYPIPHTIISDVGTQIYHDQDLVADALWQDKLQSSWDRDAIHSALKPLTFIGECNAKHQGSFKLTFEGKLDKKQYATIAATLKQHAIDADLTYSHDWFLDVTPKGLNKATAISHLMQIKELSASEICVAGDSANDTAMLTMSGINSILVANHYQEVAHLSQLENVYTSTASHAEGVLEGLKYWQNQSASAKQR